ncbi:MAG: hypothetical protein A2V86_03235 [Deltaproteobacteria bacterium RBG_16_49_23]|nr:MAG: hypothetical protein A2V86_03235 [Deltaproteobacteria bacterium RBG_16_49_23]
MKYLHKTESYSLPQRLPFIPLKGTVIFPYVMVPLFLQSKEVLTLLNKSAPENSLFGCLYQRPPFPKDPQPRDLLSVGTVCRILQLVKLPNRGMMVLIEGLSRVFIQNLILKVNPQSAISPSQRALPPGQKPLWGGA